MEVIVKRLLIFLIIIASIYGMVSAQGLGEQQQEAQEQERSVQRRNENPQIRNHPHMRNYQYMRNNNTHRGPCCPCVRVNAEERTRDSAQQNRKYTHMQGNPQNRRQESVRPNHEFRRNAPVPCRNICNCNNSRGRSR